MSAAPERDARIKAQLFPVSSFLLVILGLAFFAAAQLCILDVYLDLSALGCKDLLLIVSPWAVGAAGFIYTTSNQVEKRCQKRIEEIADATRRVAAGDFSVYIPPQHTPEKYDHLDVICADFNKMVAELGSIETLKTDFFSNVSHEIKTPLAVIQNYTELLAKPGLSAEKQQDYTQTILQATHRLSNLITNMLKLNRLEKQVIHPKPAPFDLCGQLCTCALQFEEVWDRRGIEFEADLEDRVILCADEGLLELVWTNLLSNAFKFTPDGGTVLLRQRSDETQVTVEVTDTGCGMDPQTLKHIFDKFYQGDTSHATEGNGLGLALVQRVLELSDGTIAVKSTPGAGTTFTVRLPRTAQREE